LVGRQEGHLACKKWGDGGGGQWLVRMEWHPAGWSVCLPVNLPLHHKVQKFSSGTGSPAWSLKKGRKTVLVVVMSLICTILEIQQNIGQKVSIFPRESVLNAPNAGDPLKFCKSVWCEKTRVTGLDEES